MADVTVRTLDGVAAQVSTGDHEFLVDEPPPLGANRGPDPYELLLSALGACTAITTMLYARRKGWPLEAVEVHLTHAREHTDDCASGGYCDSAEVHVELEGAARRRPAPPPARHLDALPGRAHAGARHRGRARLTRATR